MIFDEYLKQKQAKCLHIGTKSGSKDSYIVWCQKCGLVMEDRRKK